MDFLAVEYDVICTEKINIDRGDRKKNSEYTLILTCYFLQKVAC
jgi:hypothetical protein